MTSTTSDSVIADARPLDIWVSKALLLVHEGVRPCPLLMHLSEPDTDAQTRFWNPLRERLPQLVRVHYFDDIEQAGPLVVVPHEVKEYLGRASLNSSGKQTAAPQSPPKPGAAARIIRNAIRNYHGLRQIRSYSRQVAATGRHVVVFSGGLEYEPQPGEIVIGASIYRSRDTGIFPMPNWIFDISGLHTPIPKPAKPTIAFDGNTTYPGVYNRLLGRFNFPESLIQKTAISRSVCRSLSLKARMVIARWVRKKVVNEVRNAPQLQAHIRERGEFFSLSPETRIRLRKEYLKSIQDNAYLLCARGDANTDFRTNEVLAAGRIPVIIDTDLLLPPLPGMQWEDFSVIVPFGQINRIGKILDDFHNSLTEDDFQHKCHLAKTAFERMLPHHYIGQIIGEIKRKAAQPSANPELANARRENSMFQKA